MVTIWHISVPLTQATLKHSTNNVASGREVPQPTNESHPSHFQNTAAAAAAAAYNDIQFKFPTN